MKRKRSPAAFLPFFAKVTRILRLLSSMITHWTKLDQLLLNLNLEIRGFAFCRRDQSLMVGLERAGRARWDLNSQKGKSYSLSMPILSLNFQLCNIPLTILIVLPSICFQFLQEST